MERFSTEIDSRTIVLNKPQDIAIFSYSSENPIACLNLNLCEYSATENRSRPFFVSTEEKCRKIFVPSRRLLYNLHLDLAEGRESRLEKKVECGFVSSAYGNAPHITAIEYVWGIFCAMMTNFVEDALKVTDDKLRILKMLLKPALQEELMVYDMAPYVVNVLVDCFYPTIPDFDLFKDFFEEFNLLNWMAEFERPEVLEYLLLNARCHVRNVDYLYSEYIDLCITRGVFLNIRPILKYLNAPEFSNQCHHYTEEISELRSNLTEEVFGAAKNWTTKKRTYLISQIIFIFIKSRRQRNTEAATEALRVIWSSIPDAFVTFKEIEKVIEKALSRVELRDMHDFYCKSIGETHSLVEPRFLKHLCRTTVRRILCENKIWIPDGIRLTGLPISLQKFLNLE